MLNLHGRLAREREHASQLRLRQALEKPFARALSSEFKKVGKDAEKHGTSHEALHKTISAHKVRLHSILEAYYKRVAHTFGDRLKVAIKGYYPDLVLKSDESGDSEEVFEQNVNAFVGRWTAKKVTQISSTTQEKLQRVIRDGTLDNQSEEQLKEDINAAMGGDETASRCRTIARTETHAASQDASFSAAQNLGIDLTKEWVAVEDDRTRDTHGGDAYGCDGQEVAMEEYFSVGDDELMYPGDPSGSPEEVINCRCVCIFNSVDRAKLIDDDTEEE